MEGLGVASPTRHVYPSDRHSRRPGAAPGAADPFSFRFALPPQVAKLTRSGRQTRHAVASLASLAALVPHLLLAEKAEPVQIRSDYNVAVDSTPKRVPQITSWTPLDSASPPLGVGSAPHVLLDTSHNPQTLLRSTLVPSGALLGHVRQAVFELLSHWHAGYHHFLLSILTEQGRGAYPAKLKADVVGADVAPLCVCGSDATAALRLCTDLERHAADPEQKYGGRDLRPKRIAVATKPETFIVGPHS